MEEIQKAEKDWQAQQQMERAAAQTQATARITAEREK
jgi:hypothetical protein